MELLLIAIAAGFGGTAYARLKRARSDLADTFARIDGLQKAIRAQTLRLLLVAVVVVVLGWLAIHG